MKNMDCKHFILNISFPIFTKKNYGKYGTNIRLKDLAWAN